jgi:hypothetical protein
VVRYNEPSRLVSFIGTIHTDMPKFVPITMRAVQCCESKMISSESRLLLISDPDLDPVMISRALKAY